MQHTLCSNNKPDYSFQVYTDCHFKLMFNKSISLLIKTNEEDEENGSSPISDNDQEIVKYLAGGIAGWAKKKCSKSPINRFAWYCAIGPSCVALF